MESRSPAAQAVRSGRRWYTTTFRWLIGYTALFAVVLIALVGFVAWTAIRALAAGGAVAMLAAMVGGYVPGMRQIRRVREIRHATQSIARGDRALLFEAFSNLIDNAIKFAPPGGAVLRVHDFTLRIDDAPDMAGAGAPGTRMSVECWPSALA